MFFLGDGPGRRGEREIGQVGGRPGRRRARHQRVVAEVVDRRRRPVQRRLAVADADAAVVVAAVVVAAESVVAVVHLGLRATRTNGKTRRRQRRFFHSSIHRLARVERIQ